MICEKCGKEHDGTFGSGRFCSGKCAKSRNISKEYKEKISLGVKKYNKNHPRDINTYPKIPKYFCQICGKFKNGGCCQNEFCKKHSIKQFGTLIKYFGFDKSKLGTNEAENEFNRIRNLLYNLYWNKHKSSGEICKIYNYPYDTNLVNKVFKYLEIPSKKLNQSLKESYLEGRSNVKTWFAKQYWHTTWNGKEVYLRSSHEFKYAEELDKQKVDYDCECLRIKYFDTQKNEYRCAIPDFYIPSENMIVEIKSEYTLDKQNMIDKKKAYLEQGYNFKCICDFIEIEI